MLPLEGKVALVTGGSRGIGAAIVRRLAADGADVVITYERSADKANAVAAEIAAGGRRGEAIRVDSADSAAVTAAVDGVADRFGRLDILVSNAGILDVGPIEEVTAEAYERTMAVNVRAVFLATVAAARRMQSGGRIVAVGSCVADRVPMSNITLYSTSKAALVGLTKGAARDLGPRGITVNLVHPGPVDTDMNPADAAPADAMRALLAIPHYGAAEDVASAVAYLVGDGGRYVTGAALNVDGGMAA